MWLSIFCLWYSLLFLEGIMKNKYFSPLSVFLMPHSSPPPQRGKLCTQLLKVQCKSKWRCSNVWSTSSCIRTYPHTAGAPAQSSNTLRVWFSVCVRNRERFQLVVQHFLLPHQATVGGSLSWLSTEQGERKINLHVDLKEMKICRTLRWQISPALLPVCSEEDHNEVFARFRNKRAWRIMVD